MAYKGSLPPGEIEVSPGVERSDLTISDGPFKHPETKEPTVGVRMEGVSGSCEAWGGVVG